VTFTIFRLGVADRKDRATFFPIVIFGRSAERLAILITKGRQVLLEGRIQVDKDRFDVIADRVELGALPKSRSAAKPLKKAERQEQSSSVFKETTQD